MTKSASKNIQSPRVNVYKTCAHHPDKELRNDYMNKTNSPCFLPHGYSLKNFPDEAALCSKHSLHAPVCEP